jgi:CheY-like chemotaxis protein/chemotaxis receptor (MCP) glutamine deamidase CheD
MPGDVFVGDAQYRVRTLLGSCVSITLWHPVAHRRHVALPAARPRPAPPAIDKPGMYGADAMQLLVDGLAQHGVPLMQCQGKIFGGGAMFPRNSKVRDIGMQNGDLRARCCANTAYTLVSESLFGEGHRQLIFTIRSGEVLSRQVPPEPGWGGKEKDGMSGIKVMIVDDSAVVRQVLSGLLNAAPGITVTHAVANPLLAMERMKVQWPDVIVLDVEMPKMDGITFLRKLMAERPTPVVICSTLTEKGAQTSVEALTAGAVAIITKPRLDLKQFLHDSSDELVSAARRRRPRGQAGQPPCAAAGHGQAECRCRPAAEKCGR